MTISKIMFTILGTALTTSLIFNYFLYDEMVNKSELLVKSEQTEQLAIDKNKNLNEIIESMNRDRKNSQIITDNLYSEINRLNKKSQKVRTIIKDRIINEPCYSVDIPYPDGFGMHYNQNNN